MSVSWPFGIADDFVCALPFEHLVRRRRPAEAIARWRIESGAFRGAAGPCVGLLLSRKGDASLLLDTVATWALQTWPRCRLLVPHVDDDLAGRILQLLPTAEFVDSVGQGNGLRQCGVDWIVPAIPGDLLHPSLAATVARNAAFSPACITWDWLSAQRSDRTIRLLTRTRAPWRDPVAELVTPARARAFAVPVEAWDGDPGRDSWRVRMGLAQGARAIHHPEPLSLELAMDESTPLPTALSPDVARRLWGTDFSVARGVPSPQSVVNGVSILLLYRDRPELTLGAIASVLRQSYEGEIQLVLVDNQSSCATRRLVDDELQRIPGHIDVVKIEYDAPFNHSRQCNLAARASRHPTLLFLNNDVELLDGDSLSNMVRFAQLPGVATAGASIVDVKGNVRGGGFRARRVPGQEFNSPVEEVVGDAGAFTRVTIGNTFACAAVSREAYEALGGLDELSFPIGYNDVDFCLRASQAGWTHVNVAEARATHAVGASRAKADEITQKLLLRMAHPWVPVRALNEWDAEPVADVTVSLPPPMPHDQSGNPHAHDSRRT